MASAQATAAVIDSSRSNASFSIHPRLPIPSEGNFESVNGSLQPDADTEMESGSAAGRQQAEFQRAAMAYREWHDRKLFSMPGIIRTFNSSPSRSAKPCLKRAESLKVSCFCAGSNARCVFIFEKSACKKPGYDCDLVVNGSVKRRDFGMQAYRLSIKDNVDFEFRIRLLADPVP